MAFNLGSLAPLAGLQGGFMQADAERRKNEQFKIQQALQALALQQGQQQQQGMDVAGQALGQIPQAPMAPLQGGGQDQLLGSGGGMPQPQQLGGGLASSLPAPGAVKGSWFGNSPGWQDSSDSGLQASGVPVAGHPGIALPSGKTLGQQFDITTPDGRTFTAPQTDKGPAGWTGRGVDVNSELAKQMGYTPQSFPTDKQFIVKAHQQLDADVGQKGIGLIQKGAPVPAIHESTSTAKQAGREIDPQQWGRANLDSVIKAIDKVAPDAPGAVKLIAAGQLNKLLAPEDKMALQMYMQQKHQDLSLALKDMQISQAQAGLGERTRHDLAMEGIDRGRAQGGEKFRAPQLIELKQPDGTTKQVYAQQRAPGDWVDAGTGQKVDIPPGTDIGAVRSPGRQAAAQVNSMVNAGNEAVAAVGNLMDLPITANAGWMMGVQTDKPKELGEAVKHSLASNLTSDEAKSVIVSFQGVARAMATLEAAGRASGLVGLTQQAQVLMPQEGDSGLTVLRKYAEIRQLTERSMETIMASPDVGKDQKSLLSKISGEMKEAVPFTVKDINALQSDPSEEKAAAFAKRVMSRGGGEQTGAPGGRQQIPSVTEEQYNALPSGSVYTMPGDPTPRHKP